MQDRAPVLAFTALLSAALLGVSLIGLLVDPRQLLGAPLWLKPAKFGLSSAVYIIALALMTRDLPVTRFTRITSALIGWLLVGEVLLVMLQAARGVQSHFNIETAFDSAVFSAMGSGIAAVWVLSMLLLVQHVRTAVPDRTMAMALRFGLALNIVGAAVGWVMVQPSPEQLQRIEQGTRPFRIGAHAVGVPDGGPGLAITNWSRTGGDLRVPHFIGLHALQLLPLVVLLVRAVRTSRDDAVERSLLTIAAGSCAALFFTALLQALDGRPLFPLS
jgi:hypothetical protein